MTTTEEGWHVVEDGMRLYTKTWKPAGKPLAKVIFVHGFSDHCNAYHPLFPTLASRDIEVLGFDQRGWGQSVSKPSERGLTGPTELVLSDISSVLASQIPPSAPLFLMGHSMGGAEVLTYAAVGPPEIRAHITGYLAEAPFIALHPAAEPSRLKVLAGRLAKMILPNYQLVERLKPEYLSRDPDVCRLFVEDELCHDTGTLEGMHGMLDRAANLVNGRVQLEDGDETVGPVRVWVGHGTEDMVTYHAASQKWIEKLPAKDKEFRSYEGWFHKLHAEPGEDKVTFANDVANWILARAQLSSPELQRLQPNAGEPHAAGNSEQGADSRAKL